MVHGNTVTFAFTADNWDWNKALNNDFKNTN